MQTLTHHEAEDDDIVVAEPQVLMLLLLPFATALQQPKAGILAVFKEGSWDSKDQEECDVDGFHDSAAAAASSCPS